MADDFFQAMNYIRSGDLESAKKTLSETLIYELGNEEILFAMNCCNFWIETQKRACEIEDFFERGESYVNEWKPFLVFIKHEKKIFERTKTALCCGIFSLALECYKNAQLQNTFAQNSEFLRKMGICYKKLGEYDAAWEYFKEALLLKKDSAQIIAESADCLALCGEERQAKILFREAFYVAPEKIEIEFLDSELINCVVRRVREKGYEGERLLQWIPVYGQLYGIFALKRRLRPQEIARLKREIYAAENEMKEPSCQTDLLVPRLINLYFWLIDHYVSSKEDSGRISEILVKIKILDSKIYDLYAEGR